MVGKDDGNLVNMFTIATFACNAAWFGAGGYVFGVRSEDFTRRNIVHPEIRAKADLRKPVVYACKFVGGLNQGLSLINLLRFLRTVNVALFEKKDATANKDDSAKEANRTILLGCAWAHFSQFFYNMDTFKTAILLKRPETAAARFGKEMQFIFVTDLLMTLLNLWTLSKIK